MLVKTYGAAVQGIDAIVVTIETVVEQGFSFCMVACPTQPSKRAISACRPP